MTVLTLVPLLGILLVGTRPDLRPTPDAPIAPLRLSATPAAGLRAEWFGVQAFTA